MRRNGLQVRGIGAVLALAATGAAAQTAAAPADPVGATQLLQLVGGLAAVLLMIGALYFLRPVLQRLGAGRGTSRMLAVLDAIHIGPRDRIVLVEVNGRRVLLGVSPGAIRPLLELDGNQRAEGAFANEMRSALRASEEQNP